MFRVVSKWYAKKRAELTKVAHKKSHPNNGMRFSYLLCVNSVYYSAVSTAASTGASALGAAFLPARRVVFLAAALGVLSIFSL